MTTFTASAHSYRRTTSRRALAYLLLLMIAYGGTVETVHSQLEAWGVQRLHARTHEGWVIKLLASLFALFGVNAN